MLLEVGQSGSDRRIPSPLMYTWHSKHYLGAAHGLAGIITLLLQVTRQLVWMSGPISPVLLKSRPGTSPLLWKPASLSWCSPLWITSSRCSFPLGIFHPRLRVKGETNWCTGVMAPPVLCIYWLTLIGLVVSQTVPSLYVGK